MVVLVVDVLDSFLEMQLFGSDVGLALQLVLNLTLPQLVVVLPDHLCLHVLALLLLREAPPVQLSVPSQVFLPLLYIRKVHGVVAMRFAFLFIFAVLLVIGGLHFLDVVVEVEEGLL